MEVRVRGYTEEDVPGMARIWNIVVDRGMAFPQEEELSPEEASVFFGSQSHCGVAEIDGRVVGMYILHPNNVGRCGHISNASYAVDPSMSNKGIGAKLVEDSLSVAGKLGFRIMQFNAVVQENASAIHLYEKVGFERYGIQPRAFKLKDGTYRDEIIMVKML